MDQLAGFKFHPSEIDLVNYYLRPKVDDQPLPYPGIIHEVNFYQNGPNWLSENYPAQGVNNQGDQELYFFTPIYKKHPNGKRPTRVAGDGSWRAVTAESAIKGVNNATTRTLVYNYKKDGTNVKTNWIMKEYLINHESHQTTNDNVKLYDWVLCLIYQSNHSIQISKALSNAKHKKSENLIIANDDQGNAKRLRLSPLIDQSTPLTEDHPLLMIEPPPLTEVHPPLMIEPPPVQSSLPPFKATEEYLPSEAQQQFAAQFNVIFEGTSIDTSPVDVLVDGEPIQSQQQQMENLQNNYQDCLMNFDDDYVDAQTIENLLPPMDNLQNYYQDYLKNFDDDYVDAQTIDENQLPPMDNLQNYYQDYLKNFDDDYVDAQTIENLLPPMDNLQNYYQDYLKNFDDDYVDAQTIDENLLPPMDNLQNYYQDYLKNFDDDYVDAQTIENLLPQMYNPQNYYEDYLKNFDDDFVDAQIIDENLLPAMMNSFQQILNSDDASYNHTQFMEHQLPPMENQDHTQMMENQQPPMENQQPLIENELPLMENLQALIENELPPMENPQALIENELPLLENQQAAMENDIVFDNLDGNTQQNQQPTMENEQAPMEYQPRLVNNPQAKLWDVAASNPEWLW